MIIKYFLTNEVWTSSDGATLSELTTSQWKALVRAFLKELLNLQGKGGGGGMLGNGPFAAGVPDLWLGDSEADLECVTAPQTGKGREETGEDEGTGVGVVGCCTGGGTSGTGSWTASSLKVRGLGTGRKADGDLGSSSTANEALPPSAGRSAVGEAAAG